MNNDNTYHNTSAEKENGLAGLIVNLQKEDARNLGIYKRFQAIYLVFAIFYILFFIANPFLDLHLVDRISGICYVVAFLILFFVFRKYNREFRSIDYAVPTVLMLQEAAKRYAFVKAKRISVLIVPLVLVDVAVSLTIYERYLPSSGYKAIYIFQAVYLTAMAISFSIGIMIWRRKQKPLRDEALRLLAELEQ